MTISGLVFMGAFLAALLVALVRAPIVGLFAYIGVFYLHPPSRWWGAFLPDLRWSLLAAVVTLIATLWHQASDKARQRWYQTTPAKIMIVFTIWFWIVKFWALAPDLHTAAAILITKYIVVFWLIYRLIDTPQKVSAFLLAHFLGCAYLGYLGLDSDGSGRLDGVGGPGIDDSNSLGMQLATGAVVGAMLLLTLRGWRLALGVLAIALALNALVLTGSRGAFLALVGGGVVLAFFRPAEYKRVFIGYAVLGVILFGYVASEQFWSRMNTVTAVVDETETLDTSAESRIEMIKAQMKMAKDYPLGAGQRGSEVMSARYLDAKYLTEGGARSSHNVFLTVLVEQGLPGVVLFLAMVRWVGGALKRMRQDVRNSAQTMMRIHAGAIGGSLMVVLVGGMFVDFSKCEVQIWMLALLAAIAQKQMYSVPAPSVTTPAVVAAAGTRAVGAERL